MEISDAIDGSLPPADQVANMPPASHSSGVASAASPAKRQEYAPVVNNVFGDLSSLPPYERNVIAGHLGAHWNAEQTTRKERQMSAIPG